MLLSKSQVLAFSLSAVLVPSLFFTYSSFADQATFSSDIKYLSQMAFSDLVQALHDLEPYMTVNSRTKITVFDIEAAKEAGVAEPIIALAEEMVEHQNLMMQEIANSSRNMDVTETNIPLDQFPLYQWFENRATARIRSLGEIDPNLGNIPD